MIIDRVIAGSPASKVLKAGDDFVEVNGIQSERRDHGPIVVSGQARRAR